MSAAKGRAPMGKFRGQNQGVVIDCEGGYFAGDASGGAIFDNEGKKIRDFKDDVAPRRLETAHLSDFVAGCSQSEGQ